jgi:hypothetical protein
MTTTTNTPPRYAPQEPRMSPYDLGRYMGSRGTLKGLPYGPGARQQACLNGYYASTDVEPSR